MKPLDINDAAHQALYQLQLACKMMDGLEHAFSDDGVLHAARDRRSRRANRDTYLSARRLVHGARGLMGSVT